MINSGTVDSAAPALASISLAPTTPLDTGLIAQNIEITLNITDALSGLRSASLTFKDPNGSPEFGISGFVFYTNATSGDAQNGVYKINSRIPQGSLDGTWTIDVFLADQVGNRATVSEPAGATFEVRNTGGGAIGDLSDAGDATQYLWSTTGDQDWFPQATVTSDGVDAAQSGAIGDDEVSEMEITLIGPGTLDFQWKVDSEESADYLSAEVLGGIDYDEISGNMDWTSSSVSIPPGPQTVRFRYKKDGSDSEGADAGWVDQVCFSAEDDQEEPVIQRISLTPNPVDIAGGFEEVTVTIEVSDDFNGFSEGYLYLTEVDSDNEYASLSFDSSDLISGDSKFGTYEVVFEFYADDFDFEEGSFMEGTYRMSAEVYEEDSGNVRYYGNGDDSFPIPSTEFFTVGGALTGSAPILTGISSITPETIDISAGDQEVTIEFGVISNIGLSFGQISLYRPDGRFVQNVSFGSDELISGDETDGIYSVAVSVYQYSSPGTWNAHFYLSDYEDNQREYPIDTDFPNPGEEEFTVINTGTVDTADPVLTAFTLSTTAVDTSASPQSISVNFSLTDDLSGLQSISLYAYDPNDQFSSPLFTSFTPEGALSNSFSGSFDLPVGSLPGTWNSILSVQDRAGNSIFYAAGVLGFGDPFPAPFNGQFTVGPVSGTTFSSFTSTYGLTGADALAGANPDGDIFNNSMELLLGLDPTIPNSPNPSLYEVARVGDEIRIDFVIDPSLTITTNGSDLALSNGGKSPVLVTGQTGANLQNDWVDQLPTNITGSKYRVILPITTANPGMIRLKFTTQ